MPLVRSRIFVASSVFAATATLAAAQAPWTLDGAVAYALAHSPDAQVARARVDGAQALVQQAQSAWYPQLAVSGRYTDTDNPMMAFGSILNQRAFSFGLDFNRPGQIDNLDAAGTVSYNLYSGGKASAGRHAAQAGAQAASYELNAARHELAAAVVKAVLNLQKARDAVGTVEEGVRAYEAAVGVAQARYDAGQFLKADLLSLRVQLAQTEEALSSARHGGALAARAFSVALGLDAANRQVELATNDASLARLTVPETLDYSQRPELLGLDARLHAAEAMVEAARSGHRPSVNAFASYQYDHGWQLNRGADSWLCGVSVDVNLFDGGKTSGLMRQASAELLQVQELRRKAELEIGLEVEQAKLAHDDAVERLSVTESIVGQAEESASLTEARFQKDALLTADLIGAESRLIEARLRRTVAASDERMAVVDLRRALGFDPMPQP